MWLNCCYKYYKMQVDIITAVLWSVNDGYIKLMCLSRLHIWVQVFHTVE